MLEVGQKVKWYVDTDQLQEVQVNGQPAGLTGGNWDADSGQWSGDDQTLTWMKGDVIYRLSSRALSTVDLIRVAESIP